jgi:hypothetical protein
VAHDGQEFEGPNGMRLRLVRVDLERLELVRTAEFFEELYTGAAAEDPAAFLARYADEFQLAPVPSDGG